MHPWLVQSLDNGVGMQEGALEGERVTIDAE